MREERLKKNKSIKYETDDLLNKKIEKSSSSNNDAELSSQPINQLSNGLLGWYSVCSSDALKKEELNFFSMYNEPLVLYRDRENIVRCVKDICPHRGASFYGGELNNGQLVCPYHGARFSPQGTCTN